MAFDAPSDVPRLALWLIVRIWLFVKQFVKGLDWAKNALGEVRLYKKKKGRALVEARSGHLLARQVFPAHFFSRSASGRASEAANRVNWDPARCAEHGE